MEKSASSAAETAKAPDPKPDDLCVVDMGKHPRKSIRKLRRGEGKLASRAEAVVEDLKSQGVIARNANTVVLVVREKRKKLGGILG